MRIEHECIRMMRFLRGWYYSVTFYKGEKRMQYYLGLDSGSISTNLVVLGRDGSVVYTDTVLTQGNPVAAGKAILESFYRAQAAITPAAVVAAVACGYGRHEIPFASKAVTEITCHGRGVRHFCAGEQLIIDIGGEDTKVIRLDADGGVADFVMNNKCAAGTGRFLEALAQRLGYSLDAFIEQAERSTVCLDINSTCTVFAESEIVSRAAEGAAHTDLAAAVHRAAAKRIMALARPLLRIPPAAIVLTGGVAKNSVIRGIFQDEYGLTVTTPFDPQLIGAFGAALIAQEKK